MILRINRNQAKAMLGGMTFELTAKVEFTQEEAELMDKYNVHKEVVFWQEVSVFGKGVNKRLTITDLIKGFTFSGKGITEILEAEKNLREACQTMKNYLKIMKSFGGEEVYEF